MKMKEKLEKHFKHLIMKEGQCQISIGNFIFTRFFQTEQLALILFGPQSEK